MSKREVGIVRWYDPEEGCGYIARRHGEDVYVHYSALLCDGGDCVLREGEPVEFTLIETDEGVQAQEVVSVKHVK